MAWPPDFLKEMDMCMYKRVEFLKGKNKTIQNPAEAADSEDLKLGPSEEEQDSNP